MAKIYASKITKELMTEAQIKEKGRKMEEFTESWKGRMIVKNPEGSEITKKIGISTKGQFAIKT